MDMTGERIVPAPVERVWQALTDPATIKSCVAGCESMEPDGTNTYRMALATKVGPISARFSGTMRMADIEPSRAYTLQFDGSGGAAGFVRGEARVTLSPCAGGTTLSYVANAQVGGKLAQVGSRLIDGAAQKVTGDFFARFVEVFGPPAAPATPARPRATVPFVGVALVAGVLVFGAAFMLTGQSRWLAIGASALVIAILAVLRRS
jgi:carbon monoxide dehydrogenase subunit G